MEEMEGVRRRRVDWALEAVILVDQAEAWKAHDSVEWVKTIVVGSVWAALVEVEVTASGYGRASGAVAGVVGGCGFARDVKEAAPLCVAPVAAEAPWPSAIVSLDQQMLVIGRSRKVADACES